MGASLPQSGSRRGLDAELNLVPFIDLLCALISFLLMTAVWMQVSTLELRQGSEAAEAVNTPAVELRLQVLDRGIVLLENDAVAAVIPCLGDVCSRQVTAPDPSGAPRQLLQSFY